jgi:hypothetical protein
MGGFGAQTIEHVQRKMSVLSMKKSGLGSPVLSGSAATWCTITDNGVGDYTINFVQAPYAQTPEVMAMPSTPGTAVAVTAVSTLAVTIEVTDLAGVAAEGDFHILVMGSLARDLIGV